MAKTETKIEKIEREYIIPLRWKVAKVPVYKRANKAVKAIREFIVRHMKIYDRDLKKVKIDKYLNQAIWLRSIKKPPEKIKVKAVKEGEIVKVELLEMPEKIKFRKQKEEKREKQGEEKKKPVKEEKPGEEKTEGEKKEIEEEKTEGEKKEETEKKASTIEAGKALEKAAAKQAKHIASGKMKEPKHKFRQALQK